MTLYFERDTQFDFELMRTMGQVAYGGAEIGECFATARRVKEGDYDSWHAEWSDTASWLHDRSEQAEDAGHLVTARDGYLRSANYFRTAEFFLHGNPADPRIRETSRRAVRTFRRASALCDPAIQTLAIPYEGTTLPGYFYSARGAGGRPAPTVLIHNGFDGTAEEVHSMGALAGQERGYNVVAFEGPGQGQVIRELGLPFRPDWEHVVGPVIDAVAARPDVDATRIALVGISMGGVLAPRAAAHETRIAALVAWDGVYDMAAVPLEFVFAGTDLDPATLHDRLAAEADPDLDERMAALIADNGTIRWIVDHGTWVMGQPHARALFRRFADFNVADGMAERISCPTLVLDAANDMTLGGQAERLAEHLTAPHRLYTFTGEHGGALHNQVDVPRQACAVIYDWLDGVLR